MPHTYSLVKSEALVPWQEKALAAGLLRAGAAAVACRHPGYDLRTMSRTSTGVRERTTKGAAMSGDANEAVRLKEQKDAERGFDADSDSANQADSTQDSSHPGDRDTDSDVVPPAGGYGERDPQTEIPVVPSAPETHEDPQHDEKAMPSGDKPRPAHG
jgi:hypothetical protein